MDTVSMDAVPGENYRECVNVNVIGVSFAHVVSSHSHTSFVL